MGVCDEQGAPQLITKKCRYTEAVNLLYSCNTFHFIDLDMISYFAGTILPQRLHTIRSLNLTWCYGYCFQPYSEKGAINHPPFGKNTWEREWQVIASMKGLRRLHFTLGFPYKGDKEMDAKLLYPLMQVKSPTDFKVNAIVPGSERRAFALADAPFELEILKPE